MRKSAATLFFLTSVCLIAKIATASDRCIQRQSNSVNCQNEVTTLNSINSLSSKVFSSGSVVHISQPPMVLIPEIEKVVPSNLNSRKTATVRPKSINRASKTSTKNIDENYLAKIVDALDLKGKQHLNQCVTQIPTNKLKINYPAFANEINTLKKITRESNNKPNNLIQVFMKRPSQKDCFKYLDFIFMIS